MNSEALCFYDKGKMFMPLDRQIRDVPTSINFDVWADNFNITHIIHSFKKSLKHTLHIVSMMYPGQKAPMTKINRRVQTAEKYDASVRISYTPKLSVSFKKLAITESELN